jgi:hypothetical protein
MTRFNVQKLFMPVAAAALAGLVAACATPSGAGDEENLATRAPVDALVNVERPLRENVELPFTVSGWALDRESVDGAGIRRVQVMEGGCEGAVLGAAQFGLTREDIAGEYGDQFGETGWLFEVTRLREGDHTLAVRIFADGSADYDACETFPVTVED